ncbi:MAG: thiolase family protein [Dehalococcoidia bacterium]|nr:thiolase family protein [Dehalococcoidia bacterium]
MPVKPARDAYIIGVGMVKYGRYPDKSVVDLATEAVIAALKDANLTMKDIQMVGSGNLSAPIGQAIMRSVGQTGVPVVNVSNACATGSTACREAYFSVASGAFDIAMGIGSEQMGKAGLLGAGRIGAMGDLAYIPEGVMGSQLMPPVFSQWGVDHMRKYGTTFEDFARVAYKNHKNSVHNPYAQYQQEFSMEEIMNARMISWPNTLYMCCPTGDGAGAVIYASADKVRQLGLSSKAVKVAACVLTSDPWSESGNAILDINLCTRLAVKEAYEIAGIGPEDLDAVELHDCFATAELLHYENMGLAPEGEGARYLKEGKFDIGGKTAVNASGGLLSRGHPLGATGACGISEIVWQLRGEAGGRQQPNAKVGLAHVIGLTSACTVNIMVK